MNDILEASEKFGIFLDSCVYNNEARVRRTLSKID